ncbi:Mediator of RNA polymerase II transcription subunit 18 [Holothuria leucospilota]|uniref:Mediator of RNA polymerase II transcription subunit 18 n=1 Tax=Holothuria leucospilota TaxID=206669 RepID=A0A9Q1BFN4_HOLLE|nr:Mediator of RNA polymerase II transcription subunit 18 [Holothuria leucospilota]
MSSSLPGNLGSVSTTGGPNLQEYVLQGTILDQSAEALVHRLRALCDNVDQGLETFRDHEMVFALHTGGQTNNQVMLRARRSLDQADSPWQLRYLGQTDLSDKSRAVTVRSYLDALTSDTLPAFLNDIGFRLDHEFVAKGHMFRKGKMKVLVSKLFKFQKPNDLQNLEAMTSSRLVELSVVAPSGSENIADDMKVFAEQLKPLVSMDKV